jgi:hypothetical protein
LSGTTIVKDDTTITDYTRLANDQDLLMPHILPFSGMISTKGKIPNAIYSSGGGRYTLTGDQYTEQLDYCDAREWEVMFLISR